ncbi:MAG: hypothetical protein MPL62_10500 [Alphaproteobacteria bacterium]|nr:hypothetical protein [Alphaproteobacteria bacterium]
MVWRTGSGDGAEISETGEVRPLALVGVKFRLATIAAQASDASRWVRASPQKKLKK